MAKRVRRESTPATLNRALSPYISIGNGHRYYSPLTDDYLRNHPPAHFPAMPMYNDYPLEDVELSPQLPPALPTDEVDTSLEPPLPGLVDSYSSTPLSSVRPEDVPIPSVELPGPATEPKTPYAFNWRASDDVLLQELASNP
jgi:hypothetical protein